MVIGRFFEVFLVDFDFFSDVQKRNMTENATGQTDVTVDNLLNGQALRIKMSSNDHTFQLLVMQKHYKQLISSTG